MRSPSRIVILFVLLLACSREESPSVVSPDPVPLIVIALDTLRADHLPTYAYPRETAPELARLARDAVVFSNAASQASQTLISFKSFFSARYPYSLLRRQGYTTKRLSEVAVEDATRFATEQLRAVRATALLDELGRQGYVRAAFADGGWVTKSSGFQHGFDSFDSKREGLEGRIPAARSWLKNHADEPFFLFLHAYDVHCPYATREPFQSRYHREHAGHADLIDQCFKRVLEQREIVEQDIQPLIDHYDSGIESADAYLGAFLDALRSEGLYDRALIVFTSDHGESLGERKLAGQYMIGHGGLYPELLHVPLFIKFPRRSGIAARRIDQPVELVDVLPTLVEFVGGEVASDIDGRSLMPLVRGTATEHREVLTGQLPYVVLPTRETLLGVTSTWAPGRRFVLRDEFEGRLQTYDLTTDPTSSRSIDSTFSGVGRSIADETASEDLDMDEAEKAQLRALGYLE